MCQRPYSVRPMTRHRLNPGRDGGRYVARNVVPLCRPCHDLVEEDRGARGMLRRALWPAEVAYLIGVRGRAWLDAAYPVEPARVRPARSDAMREIHESVVAPGGSGHRRVWLNTDYQLDSR